MVASKTNSTERGVWLRLPDTLRLPPWQAPATWGELRDAVRSRGQSFGDLLKTVAPRLRDGEAHVALIGFPIPARVGDPPYEMYWQALLLPVLTRLGTRVQGFRHGETGYWERDRMTVLTLDAAIEWLPSENWDRAHLAARGQLSEAACGRKIAILGAGALGSVVAELLVREGATLGPVVDNDKLVAGNLVRHTLGLELIGFPKAHGVAARLNRASPHASVEAISRSFPPTQAENSQAVAACDVIIECTANDDVLGHLERFPWPGTKLFISLSLGYGARRLYCFVVQGTSFPVTDFANRIAPWLERDREESGGDYPWEGVGCWHPVFPARADDVWMMAGAAVRAIEHYLVQPPSDPELLVFEQWEEDGVFAGIRRARVARD